MSDNNSIIVYFYNTSKNSDTYVTPSYKVARARSYDAHEIYTQEYISYENA